MKKGIDFMNKETHLFLESLNQRFSKSDLNRLDGWRGFLAFIVVIAHANQVFIDPIIGTDNYVNWSFGFIAHFAVLGFFVISGIAITMSIIININRNNTLINFKEYIVARISRIYPPLFFSVFLCLLFYVIIINFNLLGGHKSYKLITDKYVARDFFQFDFKDVFNTLIFKDVGLVKVNGPLWSLIIEWWLYFLALFFVGCFFLKNKLFRIISLVLFCFTLNKIIHLDAIIYLFIWLIGSFYFLTIKINKLVLNIILICSFLGLLLVGYNIHFIKELLDISKIPLLQLLFSMLFLGFILWFPTKSIFNSISKYSYSLYIIHFPIFLFIFSVFHKNIKNSMILNVLVALLSIAIVMGIASKSYLIFEDKKKYSNYFYRILELIENKFDFLRIKKNNNK